MSIRMLRVLAHEGSDCVIRYLPDQRALRELNSIVYGKPIFAVKVTFREGGFLAYCERLSKMYPGIVKDQP